MKILVANQTLDILAGSETYILTMATELKRLGHEVTAFSPQLGIIATKLEAIGVKCVNTLNGDGSHQIKPFNPVLEEAEGKFDVAICAHYEITKEIRRKFSKLPIIAVCHGIIHSNPKTGEIFPEHPVTDMNINQYIAVSEEVQNLLKSVYNIDSVVIRNCFDLERFKKEGKLKEKPETILVNSNYWGVDGEINDIIKDVAKHYDAKFIGIGANFVPTYETDLVIKDADVVFGMGRSVIEGVCAGKIGVVHGRWGTGGVITPETYKTLKLTNFSGRPVKGEGKLLSANEIIEQIDNAWNQKTVNANYAIIKKENDVKVVAEKLLAIANELIK